MDNELSNDKIERLERELADLSESGGKDDKEVRKKKKCILVSNLTWLI